MARIMVVDDEPDIVYLTKIILEKEGYGVVEALSGEECLEKLKKEKPDLILLDVMMKGINGWEVCKKIKEEKKTKEIPVVMFTIRTSKDSVRKSFECRADEHVNKPFSKEELLKTVRELLKK